MTGAPIYLVSACSTGEEFIAAFRRYADKNGLFVPIGDPFAIGRRSRFAVTLRDGGVMLEGEAEVIASARTVSILHGRVGMTLRFLEPDAASKTTLSELERARLAMKPPPPSIPPRPTRIPAEPRPVPPPPQGRIDAVNALAECVAIGDPGALAALGALGQTTPPPATSARSGATTLPAPGRTARLTPAPIRDAAPPPNAMAAPTVKILIDGGPVSDTLVAVEPPAATAESALEPTTIGEVPTPPVAPQGSSPALSASPVGSSSSAVLTSLSAPPSLAIPSSPSALSSSPAIPTGPSALSSSPAIPIGHAVSSSPAIPTSPPALSSSPAIPTGPPPPAIDARRAAEMPVAVPRTATRPGHGPPSVATVPTLLGPPPGVSATRPAPATGVPGAPRGHGRAEADAVPAPTTTAHSAPTDIGGVIVDPSLGDATIDESATLRPMLDVEIAEPTDLSAGPPLPLYEPRTTTPGIGPAAHGSGALAPIVEERTPIDWTPSSATPQPDDPADGATTVPDSALPAGDWLIARDPASLDGWSEPFGAALSPELTGSPPPPAPVPTATVEVRSAPVRSAPAHHDLPVVEEPKVQIDPTLIEPLISPLGPGPGELGGFGEPATMPPGMLSSVTSSLYGSAGDSFAATGAELAMPPAMASPPPGSFMPPPVHMMAPPEAPAYAMDPGYRMVPMSGPAPAIATPDFVDAPNSSATLPAQTPSGRRRAVIVIASAIIVIAIGIAAFAMLSGEPAAAPPNTSARQAATGEPAPPAQAAPTPVPLPPPARPDPAPAPEAAGPTASRDSAEPPAAAPAEPAAAPANDCFAELISVPVGAEVLGDNKAVLGTTPTRLALPCAPVELTFRKGRLAPITRTITPTPRGARLKIALQRPTFLVRISSSPEGAMITLNGKQLGVTPTTVKVPAFESSALMLTKEGFEPQTETVAPRNNGGVVRSKLRKR